MTFQQLRIIRETARRDFDLTEVGNALFIAQSGVSTHIKDLEDELGLGVGIVASIADVAGLEGRLRLLDTGDPFPENVTRIAVRRGHSLRDYGYRFMRMCSDRLDETTVRRALIPERDGATA